MSLLIYITTQPKRGLDKHLVWSPFQAPKRFPSPRAREPSKDYDLQIIDSHLDRQNIWRPDNSGVDVYAILGSIEVSHIAVDISQWKHHSSVSEVDSFD